MSQTLALLGGKPVITRSMPAYNPLGEEEALAAADVVRSGVLSGYLGSNHPDFWGGPRVRLMEEAFAKRLDAPWAVSMNSASSCLYAAVAALGVGPGDEVIVPPYTMCATVTSVLCVNAIPVFADIEDQTFGLDPQSVERAISPRTKAIIVVHLFGHMARMDAILDIARRHGLMVIEDCAQAPGATDNGRQAGTMGDIGVFSLNCHKVINTGEGGVAVCRDEELRNRMALVRNHGEAVIGGGFKVASLSNMLGFNLRMGEIEAAIGTIQLGRLDGLNARRQELASRLSQRLAGMPGVIPPAVRPGCEHVWYVYPLRIDARALSVGRNLFVKALAAEGAPFYPGYVAPLYTLPMFQQRIGFGDAGCPFECERNRESRPSYVPGTCPVCERVETHELMASECIRPPLADRDVDDMAQAFEKVLQNLDSLRQLQDDSQEALPVDPAGRRKAYRRQGDGA
ncbi:MAG: cell wall bioproteinis regulatory [Desulfovibrionaceae bacterium]|nr:MAG: cell wall bioproteinis regulatory [Desulfovibrionaceae bacterium]